MRASGSDPFGEKIVAQYFVACAMLARLLEDSLRSAFPRAASCLLFSRLCFGGGTRGVREVAPYKNGEERGADGPSRPPIPTMVGKGGGAAKNEITFFSFSKKKFGLSPQK